jgi:ribonuclease HI
MKPSPTEDSGAEQAYTVYFDGGCRGNQKVVSDAAGCGCVIKDGKRTVYEVSLYLGTGSTNNIAEYRALQAGLEKCLELRMMHVVCVGDSLLVVNQMNGLWKVKADNVKPLHAVCKSLAGKLESVAFRHVLRGHNKEADALANEAMDNKASREGRPRVSASSSV